MRTSIAISVAGLLLSPQLANCIPVERTSSGWASHTRRATEDTNNDLRGLGVVAEALKPLADHDGYDTVPSSNVNLLRSSVHRYARDLVDRSEAAAYSGAGGNAQGGSTNSDNHLHDLLGLYSGDAGNGGIANSGDAVVGSYQAHTKNSPKINQESNDDLTSALFDIDIGGHGHNTDISRGSRFLRRLRSRANAYSGAAGQAQGGSVNSDSSSLLSSLANVGSGNAGHGGIANSGDAVVSPGTSIAGASGITNDGARYSDDQDDNSSSRKGTNNVNHKSKPHGGKKGGKNTGWKGGEVKGGFGEGSDHGRASAQSDPEPASDPAPASPSPSPESEPADSSDPTVKPASAPVSDDCTDSEPVASSGGDAKTDHTDDQPHSEENATGSISDDSEGGDNREGDALGSIPMSSAVTPSAAYSGAGGQAQGGSVNNAWGLINVFSNNAGGGGDANSGAASVAQNAGNLVPRDTYSGVGGQSAGGSVKNASGIINLFSNNGGHGGQAISGDAGQSSARQGATSSFSGAAGQAPGGNVEDTGGVINLFSNDAGEGGLANSGKSGPIEL